MIYFFLGGFALLSCISVAGANVFIVLSTLMGIFRCYLKKDDLTFKNYEGFLKVIIFFLLTMFLSAIFNGEIKIGLNRFFEAYVYRMFPIILVILFIKDIIKIKKLFILIISSLTITNIFAVYQFLFFDNIRANAFAASPMSLAGFLSIMIPGMFILVLKSDDIKEKTIFSIVFSLSLIALVANATRGAWIASLISIILATIFYFDNIKIILKYLLVIIAIILITVANNDEVKTRINSITDFSYQSNSERVLLWKSSYNMFKDKPIFGIGLGQFTAKYQSEYILPEAKERKLGHAHNNFMQMLGETGLIGFLGFCTMFSYFMFSVFRFWKKDGEVVSLIILSGTVGLLIQGLTEFNFGNSAVMKLYWFFMGLTLQYYFIKKKLDKEENAL